MNLFNVLSLGGEKKLALLADEVATNCRHAVWARVCHRVMSMSRSEARGYIRARAAVLVAREIERVQTEGARIKVSQQDRLVELASEGVIRAVFVLMRVASMEQQQPQKAA